MAAEKTRGDGVLLTGLALIGFAMAMFTWGVRLAQEGHIVASLVAAAVGSVSIIVGADLVKSTRGER